MGASSGKLKREIGLLSLVSLGAGGMIGSGIFAMPAAMGAVAGPGLLLAILLAGLVTTLLAIAYAELGGAFPMTGGPYAYPRLAMGDFAGFVLGWGYFLYAFIGTAAIIDVFVVNIGTWVPGLNHGSETTLLGSLVAVAFLWVFTAINLVGVKWGALYGAVTMVGRLIPLGVFVIIGLTAFNGSNFTPMLPFGMAGLTVAISLFFWSFTGFEAVVIPSDEVKNPKRNIPLAMILTMAVAISVYLLVAFTWVGMIDWGGIGLAQGDWAGVKKFGAPLTAVSDGLGWAWLGVTAAVGAMLATGGAGGNWVLFQGRIPFAMAQDKLFWPRMSGIHPRFGTPFASLIFASALATVVLLVIRSFPSVALMASITALVPYAAAALAVPILRRTKPDADRPFKLPAHGVIALLGFVFATWLIYWATWPWTLVGAGLTVMAVPMFYIFVRRTDLEWRRMAWIPVYLVGVVCVSFLGDPNFVNENFTGIAPRGLLKMPYDMIALALWAVAIFWWAFRANTIDKYKTR